MQGEWGYSRQVVKRIPYLSVGISSDQVDIKLRDLSLVQIKLTSNSGQFSSNQVDIKLGGQFSSDQVDIKFREVSSVQTKLTSMTPQQFRSSSEVGIKERK